jgi:hypothetical protein
VMNTIDTPNESLTIGARVQLSVQRYDDELSLPVARLVVAEIDPTTPEGKVS